MCAPRDRSFWIIIHLFSNSTPYRLDTGNIQEDPEFLKWWTTAGETAITKEMTRYLAKHGSETELEAWLAGHHEVEERVAAEKELEKAKEAMAREETG